MKITIDDVGRLVKLVAVGAGAAFAMYHAAAFGFGNLAPRFELGSVLGAALVAGGLFLATRLITSTWRNTKEMWGLPEPAAQSGKEGYAVDELTADAVAEMWETYRALKAAQQHEAAARMLDVIDTVIAASRSASGEPRHKRAAGE